MKCTGSNPDLILERADVLMWRICINTMLKIAHTVHCNVKCVQIKIYKKCLEHTNEEKHTDTVYSKTSKFWSLHDFFIIDPISSRIRFTVLASYEITQRLMLYSSPGQ